MNFPVPVPVDVVWMSPWYQDMPKGAAGCWMTKKSKPVECGMPLRVTVIVSVGPLETIFTVAFAFGAQAVGRPAVRTIPNVVLVGGPLCGRAGDAPDAEGADGGEGEWCPATESELSHCVPSLA